MKKLFDIINRIYSITMSIAFWGGLLPLPGFLLALLLGGSAGESISLFLAERYYPVVIVLASCSVLLGFVGLIAGGKELSAETQDAE